MLSAGGINTKMWMNLLNHAGKRTEAVLLATGDRRMRVLVRGRNDATELQLIKGQWMSDDGEAVDIESLIRIGWAAALPRSHGHAA